MELDFISKYIYFVNKNNKIPNKLTFLQSNVYEIQTHGYLFQYTLLLALKMPGYKLKKNHNKAIF